MQGWIKSYRSILDHWLWTDKPFAKGQAWIDILHLVNHTKERKIFDGKLVDVERGETITSIRKLTERWGWSNTKVKNFLNILEQEKMISLEKSDSKKTVLKVLNYAKYQDTSCQENDTETAVERQSNDTETTVKHTNKNDKNIKNDKNVKKESKPTKRFTPPSLEEVQAYCSERNNNVDAEKFIDYYTANGWLVGGKSKMRDWKASVRTWEKRSFDKETQSLNQTTDDFMSQLAMMRE